MSDPLSGFPVVVEIPVAWGEMDAFGHLNHTVYFRYMETARIAYFERLGAADFLSRNPIGPILGAISCRFRAPLAYPDTVSAAVRVSRIDEDRFTMAYAITSHRLAKLAAEGESTIVCFDYRQNRKAAVPDEMRRKIAELEAGTGSEIKGIR